MAIIQRGKVRVSKDFSGKPHVIAVLEKGEFFGEMAIVSRLHRTATVTAIDEVEALCVELLKTAFRCNYADHRLMGSMLGNMTVYHSLTQPGDVILDPFAAGLGVIQAALDLKRKIIAASFNPINLLAIRATLWPVDARPALTHLADAPKGSQRLRDHLRALYTTRCPTCGNARRRRS